MGEAFKRDLKGVKERTSQIAGGRAVMAVWTVLSFCLSCGLSGRLEQSEGKPQEVRWERQGVPQRAGRPGKDFGCDSLLNREVPRGFGTKGYLDSALVFKGGENGMGGLVRGEQ